MPSYVGAFITVHSISEAYFGLLFEVSSLSGANSSHSVDPAALIMLHSSCYARNAGFIALDSVRCAHITVRESPHADHCASASVRLIMVHLLRSYLSGMLIAVLGSLELLSSVFLRSARCVHHATLITLSSLHWIHRAGAQITVQQSPHADGASILMRLITVYLLRSHLRGMLIAVSGSLELFLLHL